MASKKSISLKRRGRRLRARARALALQVAQRQRGVDEEPSTRLPPRLPPRLPHPRQWKGILHDAIKNSRSLDEIISIVNMNPTVVRESDATGHLPLHYACSRQATLRVVQFLVKCFPGALSVTNDFKALPLHYACDRGVPSLEVIQLLVERHPEGLKQKAFFGNLPLHLVVANPQASQEVVEFIVNECPQGLGVANQDNFLPLHQCWIKRGVEGGMSLAGRVEYLAQQYPPSLFHKYRCGTSEELFLLHNELIFRRTNGGPLSGVRFLLTKLYYPISNPCVHVEKIVPEPLRFAVGSRLRSGRIVSQLQFVKVLHECIPKEAQVQAEACQQRRRLGGQSHYLPLTHFAVSSSAPPTIVDYLTKERPEELKLTGSGRRSLLSCAIANAVALQGHPSERAAKKVFDMVLLRCGPEGTRTLDCFGGLALHTALKLKTTSIEILKAILEHNPSAIYVPSISTGYTPVHLAAIEYKAHDGLYMILRKDPSLLHRCFMQLGN